MDPISLFITLQGELSDSLRDERLHNTSPSDLFDRTLQTALANPQAAAAMCATAVRMLYESDRSIPKLGKITVLDIRAASEDEVRAHASVDPRWDWPFPGKTKLWVVEFTDSATCEGTQLIAGIDAPSHANALVVLKSQFGSPFEIIDVELVSERDMAGEVGKIQLEHFPVDPKRGFGFVRFPPGFKQFHIRLRLSEGYLFEHKVAGYRPPTIEALTAMFNCQPLLFHPVEDQPTPPRITQETKTNLTLYALRSKIN